MKKFLILFIVCLISISTYIFLNSKGSREVANKSQHIINEETVNIRDTRLNNEYNSWGYDALNIEKVRKKYGVFGENVSIAILDTGVSSLEMIEIAGGVNILDTTKNPEDENGHGTFLAGIIKSIAPKADLYVVKTLKKDLTGTYEDIATGIEWARKKKVDIILMSFGGEKDTPVLKEAVQKANSEGIILISSTGNTALSNNEITYPAKYNEVIAVGAINKHNETWIGSNTGNELTTMAPGHKISSILNDGSLSTQSGTSLAAAHIAGSLALCKSHNSSIDNESIKHFVRKSYINKTPEGFPIFNLEKAIEYF